MIFLILLMFLTVSTISAQNSAWVGVFSHYWEEFNLDHSRTAIWSDLRVKSVKGKLVGTYSSGYNGDTHRRFQVNIKISGNLAKVHYDKCLPRNSNSKEPCSEGEFKRGDLLFELEKSDKDDKPVFYTIWRKMFVWGKTKVADKDKYIFFTKTV